MIATAGTAACVVVVLYAPVPASMKVLALIPILLAVGMELFEQIAIARASRSAKDAADTAFARAYFDKIAQLPDADWESVVRKPVRRQHRPRFPEQRPAAD